MFVKPHVRMSLLSKMLGEILDTRVMIKASMKGAKGNKVSLEVLHRPQKCRVKLITLLFPSLCSLSKGFNMLVSFLSNFSLTSPMVTRVPVSLVECLV